MPDFSFFPENIKWDAKKQEFLCCNTTIVRAKGEVKGKEKEYIFLIDPGPHWFVVKRVFHQTDLIERLETEHGIKVEDIDAVFLTHMHPDHCMACIDLYRRSVNFPEITIERVVKRRVAEEIGPPPKFPIYASEEEGPKRMTGNFLLRNCMVFGEDEGTKIAHERASRLSPYLCDSIESVIEYFKRELPLEIVEEQINKGGDLLDARSKEEKEWVVNHRGTEEIKSVMREHEWEDSPDGWAYVPKDMYISRFGAYSFEDSQGNRVRDNMRRDEIAYQSFEFFSLEINLTKGLTYLGAKEIEKAVKERFGIDNFEVLEVPGHSPGSLCYRFGNHIFTGDVFFSMKEFLKGKPLECPKGMNTLLDYDAHKAKKSLHGLKHWLDGLSKELNEDLEIIPGHGKPFTHSPTQEYSEFYLPSEPHKFKPIELRVAVLSPPNKKPGYDLNLLEKELNEVVESFPYSLLELKMDKPIELSYQFNSSFGSKTKDKYCFFEIFDDTQSPLLPEQTDLNKEVEAKLKTKKKNVKTVVLTKEPVVLINRCTNEIDPYAPIAFINGESRAYAVLGCGSGEWPLLEKARARKSVAMLLGLDFCKTEGKDLPCFRKPLLDGGTTTVLCEGCREHLVKEYEI